MQQVDVIVIGTGTAGKSTAEQLQEAGKKIAIIDKSPFGGTCSQRGCDPKKVLVGAAEIIARSEQMRQKGIEPVPGLNWQSLMAFKRTFIEGIPEKTEQQLIEADMAVFHGTAQFIDANTIQVNNHQLKAEHIVLAGGAYPRPLNIPGETHLIDSTAFMELEELPHSIIMVGGGYIAFEFAHVAARAGAQVTIIHQGDQPLEHFDPDLVTMLVTATEAMGVQIILNAEVTGIEKHQEGFSVTYRQQDTDTTLETSLVVHAAGRVADVRDMNLDKAGIQCSEKGISVNEYLQSVSNPAVYACGDIADKGMPLTPVASMEAEIVTANILKPQSQQLPNRVVPSAVFTWPCLAAVGMTEEIARKSEKKIKVYFQETTSWYESRRINEPVSGFKLLVDEETDLLLGAHLLGEGSDELINVLTLAINNCITTETLRKTLFTYPTRASGLAAMLR